MKGCVSAPVLLLLLLLLSSVEVGFGQSVSSSSSSNKFSREDFPTGFVFGAGTSAYQVEGAVDEDGRTPSIWDTFTQAGKMADKSTGDVASDGYHKYREDVKLMSETGLEAYRFSISWSRLLPNGRGDVNPKGLSYYNNLIDELVKHGIQPHVTLYHLDVPQVLEDEYGGWLSPRIVDDFTAYADVCFREFGDRVSHWTTVNEPNVVAMASYDSGIFPPQRCSYPFGIYNCTAGNSTVEPYIVVHHTLLGHAAVAQLYRAKYQATQKGLIGLNVYTFWFSPLTNSTADVEATQRAFDFIVGWIVNPVVFGDYPKIMKKAAGSRIPSFTKSQSKQVKGSIDFLGLNHYTSIYIGDKPGHPQSALRDFNADLSVTFTVSKNETPTGQYVPASLPFDPPGLQKVLEHLQQVYGNLPVYIHENGYGNPYNSTLNDTARIDTVEGYIGGALAAIRNGSNTRGYFVWSFLDVFEFLSGYKTRYGLYHVDFEDEDLKRRPKLSALWYRDFLKNKEFMGAIIQSTAAAPHATSSHSSSSSAQ